MFPFLKKEISEPEAAAQVTLVVINQITNNWPEIYTQLRGMFKEKFILEDEVMAPFDLSLAIIALDLQALKNLFPRDQAQRLYLWTLKCVDTEDFGKYAKEEIKKYQEAFNNDLNNGGNGLDGISVRLLHRLLGENIKQFGLKQALSDLG